VFDAVLDKAMRLCEAALGHITTFDGELFHHVAIQGDPDLVAFRREMPALRASTDSITLGRIIKGDRFVHIPDCRDTVEYREKPIARESADRGGMRTLLTVAFYKEDTLLGAIHIYRQEVRPFTDKQIALLQNFAAQAVIAMENARLLGELQARTRDLEESLEYQTATSEVLNVISRSTADVQPVLGTVVETAVRLCGADGAGITIREGEVYRYVAAAQAELADAEYWETLRQRRIVRGRDSVAGRVALEGRVVHVPDILADPDYALSEVATAGIRTILGVPLLREGAVLGTVNLTRWRVEPFTERQIELVRTFADQAVIAMENARLLGELQARTRDLEESLEYQTATSKVLNVISRSTADVQPVLDTVMETAAALCGADVANITIREGEVYRHVASTFSTADPKYWAIQRQRRIVPGRGSLAGRVALEGRVVHVADARADPDYAYPESIAAGIRTGLGVPLLREGAVLGSINLSRKRVEPYTERQIELVRTFADQAVIAIENARLLTETREALEQQTATAEVLGVINSSPGDLAPVFDAILEKAHSLCDASAGALVLIEDNRYRPIAIHGEPAFRDWWLNQGWLQFSTDDAPTRLKRGEVLHFLDAASIAWRGDTQRAMELGGVRSLLLVPLLKDGVLFGAITAFRRETQPFSEKQITLLQNFAAQAVIAIENARLLGELQARTRDLEESLEYQTATSDVLKVISRSTGDVQPVLDTVVETAARLCTADTGTIAIREGEGYRHVASTQAVAAESEFWAALRQRTIVPGRDSLAARVLLEGKAVHIADVSADPDFALPKAVAAGHRTGLGVPLLREGEVLGTIALARKRVEPYTERQIELVRTFADQAVIAMENARIARAHA
jgi:GAF domain-containing protein